MTEQTTMAGVYDFATLGVFSRSVGLATMAAGRIGVVATSAIYPVITRAEQGSGQFRRYAGLVLSGVCWATVGAAAFIGVTAADLVHLLYGDTWTSVESLLPLAVASVASYGVLAAATGLLLANNEVHACFYVDLATSTLGAFLALLLIPQSITYYLAGTTILGVALIGLATSLMVARGAIDVAGVLGALLPGLVAAAAGIAAVLICRHYLGFSMYIVVRLTTDGIVMGLTFAATLRVLFARQLAGLVEVIPGRQLLVRVLLLPASGMSRAA